MSREPLESEIKVPVQGFKPIRDALRDARAVAVQAMTRETNFLLDSGNQTLGEAGALLRLRRCGEKKLLTFKGPARFRGAVKERLEYETAIIDLEDIGEILECLGFRVFMKYEKDREEWRLGEISVVLDHTPMGDFVEVEGPAQDIEPTANLIGLDTSGAVPKSYPELWHEYRAHHPELYLPVDMLFTQ